MFPTLLKIGPITLHSYGLMIALGFLAALYGAQRDAQKRGINPQTIQSMAFWALLAGLAGTRLLHIAMFPGGYSWRDPIGWIAIGDPAHILSLDQHEAISAQLTPLDFPGFVYGVDRSLPGVMPKITERLSASLGMHRQESQKPSSNA